MSDLVGNPKDRFSHNEVQISTEQEIGCVTVDNSGLCYWCSLELHRLDILKGTHYISFKLNEEVMKFIILYLHI